MTDDPRRVDQAQMRRYFNEWGFADRVGKGFVAVPYSSHPPRILQMLLGSKSVEIHYYFDIHNNRPRRRAIIHRLSLDGKQSSQHDPKIPHGR